MLTVKNLYKTYYVGNTEYEVIKGISFSVKKGEFVGIMGPSGSGKTTLLNAIANFVDCDSGSILLDEEDLTEITDERFSKVRNEKIGFIFQDFMLFDGLTVFENVCVPQIIQKADIVEMENRVEYLLNLFKIKDIKDKYPVNISGGQKQRTAVARSLVNDPLLILADEPTGNLDSSSEKSVIDSFINAKNNFDVTIIMVTHDINAASYCDRVLLIKDGKIYNDLSRKSSREEFINELFLETKNLDGDEHEST